MCAKEIPCWVCIGKERLINSGFPRLQDMFRSVFLFMREARNLGSMFEQKVKVYGSAVMKELILKVKCFSSNWLAASSHGLSGNSDAYKVAPAGTLDSVPKGGDTSSLQVFSRMASHGDLSYMGKAKCLVHRSHIERVSTRTWILRSKRGGSCKPTPQTALCTVHSEGNGECSALSHK